MTAPAVAVVAVLYRQTDAEIAAFCRTVANMTPPPVGVWLAMNDPARRLPVAPGAAGVEITEVRTGGNVGWTGGVNRAAAEAIVAGAELLLVMNTDIDVVRPDMPACLARALADTPDLAAVSPVITWGRDGVDTGLVWYRGAKVWRRAVATRHPGMNKRVRQSGSLVATDMPSGCTMMVRGAAWTATGGFDEDLFAYFDEAEWAWRTRALGWRIAVLDLHMVVHHSAAKWGEVTAYLFGRNPVVVATKHLSRAGVWATVALQLATTLFYLPRAAGSRSVAAWLRGIRDGARWPDVSWPRWLPPAASPPRPPEGPGRRHASRRQVVPDDRPSCRPYLTKEDHKCTPGQATSPSASPAPTTAGRA